MFNVSTCCGITLASGQLLMKTPASFPSCLAMMQAKKNGGLGGGYCHRPDAPYGTAAVCYRQDSFSV